MQSSNKSLAPFACAFCPAMMPNFKVYSEHVSAAHPSAGGAYLCDTCRLALPSFSDLKAHQTNKHGIDFGGAKRESSDTPPFPEFA